MGDCFKLCKDKRHRSSSSLVAGLEDTRAEKKLEFRASIPEADDQFAIAEARCDELQSKIELVKAIKRKRKLKKRSMTHLTDSQSHFKDDTSHITLQKQSKKMTEILQNVSRMRRYAAAAKTSTRKYLEPERYTPQKVSRGTEFTDHGTSHATHGSKSKPVNVDLKSILTRNRRNTRADGDSVRAACSSSTGTGAGTNMDHYSEDADEGDQDYEFDDRQQHNGMILPGSKLQKLAAARRRRSQRDRPQIAENMRWVDATEVNEKDIESRAPSTVAYRGNKQQSTQRTNGEERPVLEIYNKCRESSLTCGVPQVVHETTSSVERTRKARESRLATEEETQMQDNVQCAENLDELKGRSKAPDLGRLVTILTSKEAQRSIRRAHIRSRRYEKPTVASQMKQAGVRYYYGNTNRTNIPFVVSKSTAPSHNIGVNIQQEPLQGNREINVIKLGRQLLRLPSYKSMSYNRILKLYREGDGIVPRFLRSISRPHYFYTSMYNLSSNADECDGATSKGRGGGDGTKQSLAAYASLYKEFERVKRCIDEGNCGPELLTRRDELSRELAAREAHIRKVVQEYRGATDDDHKALRVSASMGGETGFMQANSSYKLHSSGRQ